MPPLPDPRPLPITPFHLAQRYMGVRELGGSTQHHPLIQWWLSLCGYDLHSPDETPWCAAFVNGIAWELNLPRSGSAAARSWLSVGVPIDTPAIGFDVVILERGAAPAGHVGFYAGSREADATPGGEAAVFLLGGNQGNAVSIAPFPRSRVLGFRRLLV